MKKTCVQAQKSWRMWKDTTKTFKGYWEMRRLNLTNFFNSMARLSSTTLSWARERPESQSEWASTWLQAFWTTAVDPMRGSNLRGTDFFFAASATRRKLTWARFLSHTWTQGSQELYANNIFKGTTSSSVVVTVATEKGNDNRTDNDIVCKRFQCLRVMSKRKRMRTE